MMDKNKLSSEERKQQILRTLQKSDTVKIQELCKILNVTRETIRKDLYELELEGMVKKVYGGAVLDKSISETAYEKRKEVNEIEKRKIAHYAVSLIKEGDTVYLDYGTTTYMLAEELEFKKNITVVTNTLPIVNCLIRNKEINLIIPGGNVRHNEDSLFGSLSVNNMRRLFVDIGFFGIAGISKEGGLTNFHMGENDVSRTMILHSNTSIILADHAKFAKSALYKTADFNEVNLIITDEQPLKSIVDEINGKGCMLEVVHDNEKGGLTDDRFN